MIFVTRITANVPQRLSLSVALVASAALLASCGNATDGDVSAEGRQAYACALAEHVEAEHGSPESWENLVGDEADPGAREVSSIGALATSTENAELSDIGDQLMEGFSRGDIDALHAGLESLQDACDGVEGMSQADVSHDGQLEYACTLAGRILEEHGDAASWVGNDDSTAWDEAVSVAALTGATNGQILTDHEALSTAGSNILSAQTRLDAEEIDASLEEFQSTCSDI